LDALIKLASDVGASKFQGAWAPIPDEPVLEYPFVY
jgi:hypothetical protein